MHTHRLLDRVRSLRRVERRSLLVFVLLWALPALVSAQPGPYTDPPKWVHDKVLYEVNLRQFSRAGTVEAFSDQLPRLKALGVGVVWFMPVNPIGDEARSGTLGSPYAVKDYTAFNPEFGTLEQFKAVVDRAHEMGLYVIIDWVANHTALDHPWGRRHPDWYTHDAQGNMVPPIELWKDVVDLNYDKPELRRAMIDAMSFWVREVGVDGFRCDTAEWVPLDFWVDARNALWKIKPVFMLAEGAKPELMDYAFDAAYAWDLTPNFQKINEGEKHATDLVNYIKAEARIVPGNGFRVNFTTNHDINSWEGTTAERLGDGMRAFTVLTFTLPGMPLIYNGQEAGLDKRLSFFDRDPITWRDDPMAKLYHDLAQLKRRNPALWHGLAGRPVEILDAQTNASVLTFQRRSGTDRVVVMVNLSGHVQHVPAIRDMDQMQPVIGHISQAQPDGDYQLEPWQYGVWSNIGTTPASDGSSIGR